MLMMRSGVMAAIALCAATGARAQAPRPLPDAAGLMRTMAAEPFRYGGDVEGSLLGLPEIGTRPVHVAIGLGAASRDGTVAGSVMLFDAQRHLLAEGRVDGMVRHSPGSVPDNGAASCRLTLRLDGVALVHGAPQASVLPAGTVLLKGRCTASSLAGEIRSATPKPALLGRLIRWWGDRRQTGRYWLTADSFDPPAPS